ncbi:SIS domain-containing protein [Patescibacteria group bacterium]
MGEILKDLQSKKYGSVFESIKLVPAQFESALTQDVKFPPSYKSVKSIVLCGMGGSALGAHVLKALDMTKVPFLFYNGYVPPKFVAKDTLFIASSYSGNTEEVLSSVDFAEKKGAKIVVVAAGGKLQIKAKKKNYPIILFDTKSNPSGQPRCGVGYALGALFNIFIKLDLVEYKMEYIEGLLRDLKAPSVNKAEALAKELKDTMPIIVASEFLEGNAHILVNQINETAKTFSELHSIPELNHHLLEGLKRPEANKKQLRFLFLESDLYSPKNIKRFQITKEVISKNKVAISSYKAKGKTRMAQILDVLMFCSLVSLVLAIMYKESPTAIPWVDYFKSKL